MTNSISKRTVVRIVSFTLAAGAVLAGIGFFQYTQAKNYYNTVEYSYQRSLSDLNDSLASIATNLEKALYSGTTGQMSHLSANLWRDASVAKTSLSSLPISDLNMSATYKFLSQVGEYAMSLSRKMAAGQPLTAEEQKSLKQLWNYSRGLSSGMAEITQDMYNSKMDIHKITGLAKKLDNENTEDIPSVISGFQKMEDAFEGYPTLIYDGPFSDHIMQKKPAMLEKAASVDRKKAAERAAELLECSREQLKDESDENSNIPSYNFENNGSVVSITQKGGMISYLLRSRDVSESKIKPKEAVERARAYLENLGFTSLNESYYETANNICTVNFAYSQNGVTVYTDLIKVSVAMDNGDILSMDARGYITNHTERNLPEIKVSVEEAEKSVSDLLNVESCSQAVIPTSGMNEVYCHEFVTRGPNDEHILVYINTQTGAEEQILILIESDEGVLTK